MTRARLRGRLARAENATSVAGAPLPAPLPPAGDSQDLAREVAADFGRLVEGYRDIYKLSPQEARERAAQQPEGMVERALAQPLDQVSWSDLEALARQDPALALRRWEEVKQAARDEVRSGHRAARALDGHASACWERARFLAVRAELADAWQPRDQLEQQLLDQLAQFQTLLERSQEALNAHLLLAAIDRRQGGPEGWPGALPLVSKAQALEQATGMVERMHHLFLRSLRGLQDLRRRGPSVVVRRAGQVNIAQQQVNVAGGLK